MKTSIVTKKQLYSEDQLWWLLIYLAALNGYGPIGSIMFSTSLPQVQTELEASKSEASTAVSLYLLSGAIGPLVLGYVGDAYGRKVLLLLTLIFSILSTFLCMIATTFLQLIFFKVMHGFVVTSIGTVTAGMVADLVTVNKGQAMGKILVGTALAPVLGPLLGGTIVQFSSWRIVFLVMFLAGIIYLVIGIFCVKETALSPSKNYFSCVKLFLNPLFLMYSLPAALMWGLEYFFMKELSYLFVVHYKFSRLMTGVLYLPLGIGIALGSIFGGNFVDKFITDSRKIFFVIFFVPFQIFCFGYFYENLPLTLLILFFFGFFVSFCNCLSHVLLTTFFPKLRTAAIGTLRFMNFLTGFLLVEGGKRLEELEFGINQVFFIYGLITLLIIIPLLFGFFHADCKKYTNNENVLPD